MLSRLLQVHTHTRTVEVDMRYSLLGWLFDWSNCRLARRKNRPRRGFGCITDIVLGLIGSVLGGGCSSSWEFSAVVSFTVSPQLPLAP